MGKSYLIISPNPWGDMHISKHNYAIELERQGNAVYFMNPPNQKINVNDFLISKIDGYDSLFIIDYSLVNSRLIDFMRFRLKFTWFYDNYLFKLVKRISKLKNIRFSQVWNFDPNLHGFIYKYPAEKKVFFIADTIQNNSQTRGAKNADVVVSVAEEILKPFRKINSNCLLINHGLNRHYETYALKMLNQLEEQKANILSKEKKQIHVGYIGNLLIPFLYEDGLRQIVIDNPDVNFHFWGAHNSDGNNLLSSYDEKVYNTVQYIKANCKNANFYGVKVSEEIIRDLDKIDIFIYVNSSVKDINGGANSHKIVEYLSTGKVIVSTYLSFYQDKNLIQMANKNSEKEFARIFAETLDNIEELNSKKSCIRRINYALGNKYETNVKKIKEAI